MGRGVGLGQPQGCGKAGAPVSQRATPQHMHTSPSHVQTRPRTTRNMLTMLG